MINDFSRWLRPTDEKPTPAPERPFDGRPPICFIVDEDEAHRRFMALVLQGHGIETGVFANAYSLREGLIRRTPDLVFLDIPVIATQAMEAMRVLVDGSYRGPLQLVSSHGEFGIDAITRFGERNSLKMLPTVRKPVDRAVIKRVVREQKLDTPITASQRINLETALRENWIDFWYQPKIDLRRKQLAGVELFARVRHPEHGVMPPGAFMDDADENSLIALTEKSVIDALETGLKFSKMRINLKLAVNVSINALVKLSLPAIVREHRHPVHSRTPISLRF